MCFTKRFRMADGTSQFSVLSSHKQKNVEIWSTACFAVSKRGEAIPHPDGHYGHMLVLGDSGTMRLTIAPSWGVVSCAGAL